MSLHYYVIDTETTGLSATQNEMTEIGIVRCTDRFQLHRKIKCEHPERASADALRITGKTMADLAFGDSSEEVVTKCNNFFNQDGVTPVARCIIAHNATFDKKFLHALWEKAGQAFPADLWLDTMDLTTEFLKKADPTTVTLIKTATGRTSKTLHACLDMASIKKLADAHNAKVDSRNTYLLWKGLIDKNVDYLPYIKSFPHMVQPEQSIEELLEQLNDIE